jgi:hypothetical protein
MSWKHIFEDGPLPTMPQIYQTLSRSQASMRPNPRVGDHPAWFNDDMDPNGLHSAPLETIETNE